MTVKEVRALCAAMGAEVMKVILQKDHFGCNIVIHPYEAFEYGVTEDDAVLKAWDKLMRIMNQ